MRTILRSHGELLLVFAVGSLAQLELWLDPAWAADRRRLAPLALAMAAALFGRVRWPLLTAILLIAGFQIESALLTDPGNDPMSLVVILLVGLYSAGAHTRGRRTLAAVAIVLVAIFVAMIEDGESMNLGGFLFFAFFIGSPFLAGIVMRIRRERESLLVSEREERARAAVAEERTRVARELHDVVAHAVSVIVLQARGARHSLEREPDEARSALDAIEATAGSALTEMRRLLAVLRDDLEGAALAPQPTLGDVSALVEKVQEAGLPVELDVSGDVRPLPAGVELSAYRIVQEALTNALKHAGAARARVRLRYTDEHIEIEVVDDGRGATNGDGGGHGLVGMHERVLVYGGELDAGPRDEGGFAVRARLPL